MVQGKDWQAVPHRLQNLHAERIPQAGEQESIGPLIQVGQFIPWSCAKEFHPVLNLQVARSVFPWAAHFAIARDQQLHVYLADLGQGLQGQGQSLSGLHAPDPEYGEVLAS